MRVHKDTILNHRIARIRQHNRFGIFMEYTIIDQYTVRALSVAVYAIPVADNNTMRYRDIAIEIKNSNVFYTQAAIPLEMTRIYLCRAFVIFNPVFVESAMSHYRRCHFIEHPAPPRTPSTSD